MAYFNQLNKIIIKLFTCKKWIPMLETLKKSNVGCSTDKV